MNGRFRVFSHKTKKTADTRGGLRPTGKKAGSGARLFWARKAANYPLPFESSTAPRTARIVRLLEGLGVDFRGRSLLDIGCGTGIYGLFLARRASRVLGVDYSRPMLARFKAETRARKIKNAACLLGSWSSVRALPGAPFDIALASMSAAIRTRADILRMERMSREKCVCIGWAGKRWNSFMGTILAEHGIHYGAPDGGLKIAALLRRLGRKPEMKIIADNWSWSGTSGEALADALAHLKLNHARVRRRWLEDFVKRRGRNGRIAHKILARKVLLVWRPPGGKRQANSGPLSGKPRAQARNFFRRS